MKRKINKLNTVRRMLTKNEQTTNDLIKIKASKEVAKGLVAAFFALTFILNKKKISKERVLLLIRQNLKALQDANEITDEELLLPAELIARQMEDMYADESE